MPVTWQGSIGETMAVLLAEGYSQDQAAAIAYALADRNKASAKEHRTPLLAITNEDDAAAMSDEALIFNYARLMRLRSAGPLREVVSREVKRRWKRRVRKADHAGADPGIMLAFMVPTDLARKLALASGEPAGTLHCTVAYLGRASEMDDAVLTAAKAAIKDVCDATPSMTGRVGGAGMFHASATSDGEDVVYAVVDVPGLSAMRQKLAEQLAAAGVPPKADHDFNPHITLAYGKEVTVPSLPKEVREAALKVGSLALVIGDELVEEYPLAPELEKREPIIKADGEQRYTLSIAYPADQMDAHREFTSAGELEATAWQYARKKRAVGLMHKQGTEGAGEIVESYIYRGPSWDVGGETVKEGDWLVGIIWSKEAWEGIKSGRYQGISFQGWATRNEVTPPKDLVAPVRAS